MRLLHSIRFILAGFTLVGILVLPKSTGTGSFRYDAKRWAEPSFTGRNTVQEEDISTLAGEKLIILLSDGDYPHNIASATKAVIPADSILAKKFLKLMSDHKGPVLLFHDDISVSARIWMLLSQTGFRNLYIIDTGSHNEVFKEEFRNDTKTIPELNSVTLKAI
jgi:hypothetical protein